MLQNLGACDIAVFIDMPHHEHRDALTLAQLHHGHGAVFHLRDASRGGLVFLIIEGLDGVYDENIGFHRFCGVHNVGKSCFRENKKFFRRNAKTLCPKLQLPLAFLAGHVQHPTADAQTTANLQQKRGLADAGSAAHQHQTACNRAAAQNPIQFPHAGGKPDFSVAGDFPDALGLPAHAHGSRFCLAGGHRLFHMFLHGIVRTAAGAASHPLGGLIAAVGAVKNSFRFRHCVSPLVCFLYYISENLFGQVFDRY